MWIAPRLPTHWELIDLIAISRLLECEANELKP